MQAVRMAGRTIEFWAECALAEKTRARKLVHEWTEGTSVSATVAIAPQPLWWHVGKAEDARLLRSERDVQRFAGSFPHGFRTPLEVIGCTADSGLPISAHENTTWLLGVTPGAALASAAAEAIERGIVTAALGSSTLDCLAALTTALKLDGGGTVRLWDIGWKQSHVFTVGIHGVEAVTTCAIGFESVFATVNQLLGTKNAQEAAGIFMGGPPADPAFAPRLAATLKPQLETALQAAPAAPGPVTLACTGLTAQQSWFSREMASAVGLQHWTTDLARYLGQLELRLPPVNSPDAPSLAMLGALHLAAAPHESTTLWHPTWGGISRRMATSPGTPEPSDLLAEKTSWAVSPSGSGLAGTAEVMSSIDAPEARAPSVVASPEASPTARAHITSEVATARVARTGEKSASYPDKLSEAPVQPLPPAASSVPPAPARPSAGIPATLPPPQIPPAVPPRSPEPSGSETKPTVRSEFAAGTLIKRPEPVVIVVRKRGYWLHAGLFLALVGAALAWKFYLDSEATRAAAEKASLAAANTIAIAERGKVAAEEHARRATAQVEESDQRARASAQANAENAAKIRQEADTARMTDIAEARREAEEQTRRSLEATMAAARAATVPGELKIATDPAGADVEVDGRPAQRTPVSIADLAPGPRPVKITLAGHVPKEITADVTGSKVTDLGVITLERATGSLAVSSWPAGIEFSIRAANTPANSIPIRRGQTPAQMADLPTGNYVVHFKSAGWAERSERVTIDRGVAAAVGTTYQGGTVTIISEPVAEVSHNGLALGPTPLTLRDVPPGDARYELNSEGYEPLKVTGTVVGGREVLLQGKLLDVDRLVSEAELRTPPRPYLTMPLQLGRIPRSTPAYIKVSFVVLRDGSLYDVAVLDQIDRKVRERAVETISKWKYYPGVSPAGFPVNVRITIPVKLASG